MKARTPGNKKKRKRQRKRQFEKRCRYTPTSETAVATAGTAVSTSAKPGRVASKKSGKVPRWAFGLVFGILALAAILVAFIN